MDPQFEFDAPKWFDLADFASKEESQDANTSLNSSWFDHTHPLHESQDSLDEEESDKATNSSSLNKTKTIKKYNSIRSQGNTNVSKPSRKLPNNKNTQINPKKSLGVKSTIRVKRGDRAAIAKDKNCVPEATSSGQTNKNVKDNEQGRKTPDGFDFGVKNVFTPPFSPSAGNDLLSTKSEKCTAVLNLPQRVPCSSDSTSPEHKPLLSPKHFSVASQKTVNKASITHPPSPIKTSLRAKTINKAAVQSFQRGDKNCTSKRRQLPAIPVENIEKRYSPNPACEDHDLSKKNPPCTTNHQVSIENGMHNQIRHQYTVSSSPASDATDTDTVMSHQMRQEMPQQLPLRTGETADPSIEEMIREHNLKVYKGKSRYNKHGRRVTAAKKNTTFNKERVDSLEMKNSSGKENKLSDIESSDILRMSKTETKTVPSTGVDHALVKLNAEVACGSNMDGMMSSQELSIQEMLLQHQRKIMSAKCKYDINGRRIQSATPSFCPAPVAICKEKLDVDKLPGAEIVKQVVFEPTKSSATIKPASSTTTKYLRRSCVAAPDTSQPNTSTIGKKRLANSASSSVTVKQKRRSCVELPSIASGATVECLTAAVKPKFLLRSSSSASTLSQTAAIDNKSLSRQKRRSCMEHTLASPCDVDDTEREIREMIARHNSKIAAKNKK